MPYTRRSRSRRGYKKKLTRNRVLRASSKASTQKRQIAKLAGNVARINKAIKEERTYSQFMNTKYINMSSSYALAEISPLQANRTKVFNDPTAVGNKSWFRFTKCNMDFQVIPANENSPIDMTMFVVSYKKENARKVNSETSTMTQMIAEIDYVAQNGKAMLNMGRFNIHYVKRLQTFETTQDGDQQTRGFTRGYFKKAVNWKVQSATGDWDTTIQDIEWPLDKRLFVVVFNNNSSLDAASPQFRAITLWTGYN